MDQPDFSLPGIPNPVLPSKAARRFHANPDGSFSVPLGIKVLDLQSPIPGVMIWRGQGPAQKEPIVLDYAGRLVVKKEDAGGGFSLHYAMSPQLNDGFILSRGSYYIGSMSMDIPFPVVTLIVTTEPLRTNWHETHPSPPSEAPLILRPD